MRRLMEETGETANLGIERRDQVLFVSQVETHASIRAFFPPGTQLPMHASGIGKAQLAQYSESRVDRILGAGLERFTFTFTTLTDPDQLRQELEDILTRGYSVDNEEKSEGMRCIAAAVFDARGEAVAGVSVSGPVSRVTMADAARLGQVVVDVAREISLGLGPRVPETSSQSREAMPAWPAPYRSRLRCTCAAVQIAAAFFGPDPGQGFDCNS